MKQVFKGIPAAVVLVIMSFIALPCVTAKAADQKPAANSQQDKMKSCNAEASKENLKGDARKEFMSKCLSAEGAAPKASNSQQEKMKTCNADASKQGLKGDARKEFMSKCLSSDAKK
jgi:hypothetical protein